jgi:hypothetical protein
MVTKALIAAGILAAGLSAPAATPVSVPTVACQNPNEAHVAMPAGSAVRADLPRGLAPEIAFYADTERPGASFAPAGWSCRVNVFPDMYDIQIMPQLTALIGLSATPAWRQPMVSEQILSAEGALPERLSFDALAATLFPRLYPGGPDKWVGAPLRSAGRAVSAAQIRAFLPVGPRDVVTAKSPRLVEFMTPAGAQGLGTTGAGAGFVAPAYPVYGVAGLSQVAGGGPAIIEIFEFRLPPELEALRQPLMKLAEDQITGKLHLPGAQ